MKVRIRRLDPAVELPRYQSRGAAAFDLASRDAVVIAPGEVQLVGTGLVVAVPEGHFLAVIARSSLPLRKGLLVANGLGIVDSDYRGEADEVKVEVYNFTSRPVSIERGERIAQGLILPVVHVVWEEVEESGGPSRGGFGSTGGYDPGAAGGSQDGGSRARASPPGPSARTRARLDTGAVQTRALRVSAEARRPLRAGPA